MWLVDEPYYLFNKDLRNVANFIGCTVFYSFLSAFDDDLKKHVLNCAIATSTMRCIVIFLSASKLAKLNLNVDILTSFKVISRHMLPMVGGTCRYVYFIVPFSFL